MPRPRRTAECHPDRPHLAKGMCQQCYVEANYEAHREEKRAYNAAYYEAHREELRAYGAARREAFYDRLADIKLAAGCADCGFRDHPVALDFDHIPERGPKRFSISSGHERPWLEVLDEIAKCEVVCANCHRIRTTDRRQEQAA